jgi:hypothetical protein
MIDPAASELQVAPAGQDLLGVSSHRLPAHRADMIPGAELQARHAKPPGTHVASHAARVPEVACGPGSTSPPYSEKLRATGPTSAALISPS